MSGGPDSLALLLLAHAAIPGRFEAATVDHGLRPEGAREAQAVAALCSSRGIVHAVLPVLVEHRGNLQANARAARYAALARWAMARGLTAIVTAHHADDQAETLLMRLNRGAGLRGLAAMRPRAPVPGQPILPLLRPLLGWRRHELAEIVAMAGLIAAEDPSNADPRFERAELRRRLAGADWFDRSQLAESARHLGEAEVALEWAAEREWCEQVDLAAASARYRPVAPRVIRLRVLERIVATLGGGTSPRGSQIARWADRLDAGGVATLAGLRGAAEDGVWHFRRAPARSRREPAAGCRTDSAVLQHPSSPRRGR